MAMNDGDIIAVKFCQKFLSRDVCMVWTITTENPTGAVDLTWLVERLKDYFTTALFQLQSTAVLNNAIRADNLTDGVSFAETGWSGGGGVTGEHLPPFTAFSIRLMRGSKITRMGFKRVPGVVEAANNNGSIASTHLVDVEAVATLFGEPALLSDVDGSVQIAPVIVGRTTAGAYDLTRVQPVTGWQVVNELTTQNSRKS